MQPQDRSHSPTDPIADGFLHLLKAEPTLLPAAPEFVTARQMDDRVMDEVHRCAQAALVAETSLGKRWVDLCYRCTEPLRDLDVWCYP